MIPVISFPQQYFQQEVNNTIKVTLHTENHSLSGNIRIEYINNSPDTLQSIYFHCWPNAYRDNNTAFAKQQLLLRSTDFYYSDTENRGYIDSLAFTVDGHSASIQPTEFADVCLLKLPQILYPRDTIIIETPFYVKIPDSFSRMGHVGQTYQITQWYPKPAVYDQYGWHYMPYLDMGEFYSEFGRFDVSITVPADYVVAATGNLITRQELEWLEDLWLNPDNPRTKRDGLNQKTIRYVEENIHDFAWFADPDFRVYCDTVLLPGSGRPVRCWSFVNKENVELWSESVKYVKEAVRFYSARLGDYPYANCTAVDGALSAGSGMEYPGITIVSDGGSKSSLERVIVHEVGHNWFYGILASNERQYPWIDEGFNSFYEKRFFDQRSQRQQYQEYYFPFEIGFLGLNEISDNYMLKLPYRYLTGFLLDQPSGLASEEFSPANYWVMTYQKPVLVLQHLLILLGHEKFDSIMSDFYALYRFKHVYPENVSEFFQQKTGQNMDWFFEGLIHSTGVVDYRITKCRNDSVLVKNAGEIAAPLLLFYDDTLCVSKGFTGTKSFFVPDSVSVISIDKYQQTTGYNYLGNYYRRNALFPLINPMKFRLAGVFDFAEYSECNMIPLLAFNTTQKLMIGAGFYNICLTPKAFEWFAAPLFAPFRANSVHTALAGNLLLRLNFYRMPNFLKAFHLESNVRKFSFETNYNDNTTLISWLSIRNSLSYNFRKNHRKPYSDSYIELSMVYAGRVDGNMVNYNSLKFRHSDNRILNPYRLNVEFEHGPGYLKSWVDLGYKLTFYKKTGLEMRLFAGKFLYNAPEYFGNFNFRLSGNLGLQDYRLQETYVSRGSDLRDNSASFWAHQFTRNDGGFVSYTPVGQTNNWMVAVNFTANTPIPCVNIFANAGTWSGIGNSGVSKLMAFETGVELRVVRDLLSIYLPVWVSRDIQSTNTIYFGNYFERIRFTLNLNLINPLLYRNKLPYLI